MNFFLNCRAKLGLQNKKKFIKFGLLDAEIFTKNNFLSFGEKWCFWLKVHYDLYTRFPGPNVWYCINCCGLSNNQISFV
jgi:hypothetical protein